MNNIIQKKSIRRSLILLITVIIFSFNILSCSNGDPQILNDESTAADKTKTVESSRAKYPSQMNNILNEGLAVKCNDMLVLKFGDGVYQVTPEKFEKKIITNDLAYSLNIHDNWAYYSNVYPGKGEIYKVNFENGESKRINNDKSYNLVIQEESIYYWTKKSIGNSQEYSIKKLDIITNEVQLVISLNVDDDDVKYLGDFYLNEQWIYYRNPNDDYKLYRKSIISDLDEKVMDQLIHNDSAIGKFIVKDLNIYFTQPNKNNSLYMFSIESGETTLLINRQIASFNFDDKYIYFSDMEDNFHLYRSGYNSEDVTLLSEHSVDDINIVDDYLYCQDFYKETQYYLLDFDGRELMLD